MKRSTNPLARQDFLSRFMQIQVYHNITRPSGNMRSDFMKKRDVFLCEGTLEDEDSEVCLNRAHGVPRIATIDF